MYNLVYNGVFTKNGVEVFRSQMIAGYVMVVTAARFQGGDGYAIERNTRYADHVGGGQEMIGHLLSGRPLQGWTLRKILEEEETYGGAVAAVEAAPYCAGEYDIISGVGKGVIVAKGPDAVAYTLVLGERHSNSVREDYIIVTNFDYIWGDIREWFDPTG